MNRKAFCITAPLIPLAAKVLILSNSEFEELIPHDAEFTFEGEWFKDRDFDLNLTESFKKGKVIRLSQPSTCVEEHGFNFKLMEETTEDSRAFLRFSTEAVAGILSFPVTIAF